LDPAILAQRTGEMFTYPETITQASARSHA
jgi:hypothetical protein